METSPTAGTTFATKRDLLSLENEALGLPDVDRDRALERRFVPLPSLQDFIDTMAAVASLGDTP